MSVGAALKRVCCCCFRSGDAQAGNISGMEAEAGDGTDPTPQSEQVFKRVLSAVDGQPIASADAFNQLARCFEDFQELARCGALLRSAFDGARDQLKLCIALNVRSAWLALMARHKNFEPGDDLTQFLLARPVFLDRIIGDPFLLEQDRAILAVEVACLVGEREPDDGEKDALIDVAARMKHIHEDDNRHLAVEVFNERLSVLGVHPGGS